MIKKSAHCLFCVLKLEKEKLLYEDDFIFVFHDIHKASAKEHILVCPKSHIHNILFLNKEHIPLILLMKQKALFVLDKLNKTNGKFRLGFHYPPMVTVNHLHLHGFIEPLNSKFFNFVYKNEDLLWTPDKIKKILQTQTIRSYYIKRLIGILLLIVILLGFLLRFLVF